MQRLDKQQQSFFFLQDSSSYTNLFIQDQRLTHYCTTRLCRDPTLRDKVIRHLDLIEKDLLDQDKTTGAFVTRGGGQASIKEEEDEESGDNNNNRQGGGGRLKMIFMREEEERQADEDEEEDTDIAYGLVMNSKYHQEHAKRTKGYVSSQAAIVQSGSRTETEDEDEDPEAYKYPKIHKNEILSSNQYEEDDEEADLESQKFPLNSGRGAVGKLKALKNSKLQSFSTKQPFQIKCDSKNLSLQDEDAEDYSSDFECEAEEDKDHEESKYFKDFGTNQAFKGTGQQQKVQVLSIIKPEVEQTKSSENPLMNQNKYFFWKREIIKNIEAFTSQYCSQDILDMQAFSFIKSLSTSLSLESVLTVSLKLGRTLNFSSRLDQSINAGSQSSSMSNLDQTVSIPFKQKLYQYLLKLNEDSSWEDILDQDDVQQVTPQLISDSPPTSKQAASKSINNNTSGQKTTKPSEKITQAQEGSNDQQDQQNQPVTISKAKKKREKQKKRKNELAAATQDQGAQRSKESSETKTPIADEKVIKEIKQEKLNIQQVRELLIKSREEQEQEEIKEQKRPLYKYESPDLYRDSCTLKLPHNSLISKSLAFNLNDEYLKQAITQKRHIEERTSLLTGLYQKDKYAEDYFMDPTTSATHTTTTAQQDFFMDDPTIVPNKIAPVMTYHSVLHNTQQEDVDMLDESATGDPNMQNDPNSQGEAKQEGKKKKRKKNKKSKKKNKGGDNNPEGEGEGKEPQQDPDEIRIGEIQIEIDESKTGGDKQEVHSDHSDEINDPLFNHGPLFAKKQEFASKGDSQQEDKNSESNSEGRLTYELPLQDQQYIKDTLKLGAEIEIEIENFLQCQKLSDSLASNLIQGAINNIEQDDDSTTEISKVDLANQHHLQTGNEQKKVKKNKKGQKQLVVAPPPPPPQPQQQMSKAFKKQQKKIARLAKQSALQQQKQTEQVPQLKMQSCETQNPAVFIEELIIDEDDIKEEIEIEKEEEEQPLQSQLCESETTQEQEIRQSRESSLKKVVEFQIPLQKPRQVVSMTRGYNSSSAEDQDDNIRVPKRGSSSRGSSCGEEKIHQDTLSNLEELFAQQYKNPSPDTKQFICKITSSSSGSNKDGSSNEKCSNFGSQILSPDPSQSANQKQQRPNTHGGHGPKFIEDPFPNSSSAQSKKRENNHKLVQNFSELQTDTQLRLKPKAVRQQNAPLVQAPPKSLSVQPQIIPELQGYDPLFKECQDDSQSKNTESIKQDEYSSTTELQSSNTAQNEDSKSEVSEPLQISSFAVTLPDVIQEETKGDIPETKQPLSDSQQAPIQPIKQHKNKRKGKQAALDSSTTNSTSTVVKEMKERGAYAKPSDIENAAQKSVNHPKKDKHNKQQLQQHDTSSGFNIQRSQTPNAQIDGAGLIGGGSGGNQRNNGNHNHQASTPAQGTKVGQKQNNKQGNQKNQNQNNKRKQGNNGQNNKVQGQPQPVTNQFEQMPADPQQQYQALFQQQFPNYNLLAMQNQLLMNQQAAAFGLPFSFNPNLPGNFMPQNIGGIGIQGNPYFGNQDFSNYHQTSFQTQNGGSDTFDPLSQQSERNSQQTQTDETRIKDQQANTAPPVVMNQFQNINVQLHLPGQGIQNQPNQMGSNISQAANPMFMYPNFPVPGQNQIELQQQFLQQQMLQNQFLQQQAQSQMILQNLMGGISDPAILQNFLNLNTLQNQTSMMFNPFLFGSQQPFQVPLPNLQPQFTPAAHPLLNNLGLQPSPLLLHQPQPQSIAAPFAPQTQPQQPPAPSTANKTHISHRSPSFNAHTPSPSFFPTGHPQHHSGYQHSASNNAFLQSLITELALQSNRPTSHSHHYAHNVNNESTVALNGGSNIGVNSQVSHMNQDQYLEMNKLQQREEQFYFKFDQEIYKLQEKLKFKLSNIEVERANVIKRIEAQVRQTYYECPNAKIHMYGSMATGLAIDSSDMDLLISGIFDNNLKIIDVPGINMTKFIDRQMLIDNMRRLYAFVSLPGPQGDSEMNGTLRQFIQSSQIIETASVPVIKLVIDLQKIRDCEFGSESQKIEEDMRYLKIDITFNEQENDSQKYQFFNDDLSTPSIHMGIKCCNFIKEQLQIYSILDSLTLVLKKFLAIRNLNSPFLGGLNSYGLIILILAYLKQDYEENTSPLDGTLSGARTLRGFLFFYSRFDPTKFLINEDQLIITHQNFSSVLIIQDPLNPQNNIGKSTFNFDAIKSEFGRAHDIIAEIMDDYMQQEISQSSAEQTQEKAEGENIQAEDSKQGGSAYKKKLDILDKILKMQSNQVQKALNE